MKISHVTRHEIASILDVSPRTLSRMIERGEFPRPDSMIGRTKRWSCFRLRGHRDLFGDGFDDALIVIQRERERSAIQRAERQAARELLKKKNAAPAGPDAAPEVCPAPAKKKELN